MSQQNKPENFVENFAANPELPPLQNGSFAQNFALQKPFAKTWAPVGGFNKFNGAVLPEIPMIPR